MCLRVWLVCVCVCTCVRACVFVCACACVAPGGGEILMVVDVFSLGEGCGINVTSSRH